MIAHLIRLNQGNAGGAVMRNEEGYRDDITIEEEATEQEVRSKLDIGHIIPDFRLQTVDGRVISPTDYK